MFGWLGEIAKVFQGLGLPGAVVFALLIVIFIQYRMNIALLKSSDDQRKAITAVIENSTSAQVEVASVLSRIEAHLMLRRQG